MGHEGPAVLSIAGQGFRQAAGELGNPPQAGQLAVL